MIKSQILPKFVVDMKKIEPKNISEKKVFEKTKPKPKSIKSKGK